MWRNADFRKLWAGQAISEIGSRITRDGVPLAAVLVLQATPSQMGLLSGTGALAVLLASPLAGVWADRVRRRPLLIAADVGRAAIVGSIPLAALLGTLTLAQLYVVALLAGMLTVLFEVAYHSYVPSLVESSRLVEANSRLALTQSVAELCGPGLTGVLVQTITAPIAILFDALSFLVSALSVAAIRAPEPPPQAGASSMFWRDTIDGWRVVLAHPVLAPVAGWMVTCAASAGVFMPLYVLWAVRDLGLSPVLLGITVTVGGAGNLLGATLCKRFAKRLGIGLFLVVCMTVSGAASLLIGLAHGPVVVATAMLMASQLVGDAAFVGLMVTELSLRQAVTPVHALGRVNAAMTLAFRGALPLGAIAGGLLAEGYGVRATLLAGSAGMLLSTFWFAASRIRGIRTWEDAA